MEDRISLNLIYISLLSACFAVVMTTAAFFSSYISEAETSLNRQADLIASVCSEAADLQQLNIADTTISLYDENGNSLYLSGDTDEILYEEILQNESGRYTTSDGSRMLYATRRISNVGLLCVSQPRPELFQVFSSAFGYILIIFLVMIPLSFLCGLLLTRRLLKPIRELPKKLESPSLDPAELDIYPELVPMLQEISDRRNEREAMRQEFTANVSHELKTPLTAISGYSEMIVNGLAKPEDIPRFADKIHTETERMQQLVGDIIELNALDSETEHEHEEEVDILSLVQDCFEQLAPQFSVKRLSVYITGDGFSVHGNRQQLWELVYNLIDNARRYNVEGGMIRVSVADYTLRVKDTGIGIPQEHQARVFERFYRVDKSHSRATGGTGLGLSIVKHVAELHHAQIELDSQEHIGTEIIISFPAEI